MILILILHVLASLVLIAVILLQAGKGGGLSETFGGASQQLFGTKSSTFLNRATSVCAVIFLITCLSLGILSGRGRRSLLERTAPETPLGGSVQSEEVPAGEDAERPQDKTTQHESAPSTP